MTESALEAACVSALDTRDVPGMLSILSSLPHDLAERTASLMRDEGNVHLKSEAYDQALSSYTKVLLVVPNDARTHANMSLCYMKMKKFAEAETAARECVRCNGQWSKGYYRLGCALQSQRREEEALVEFKHGLKREPESDALRRKVSEIATLLQVSEVMTIIDRVIRVLILLMMAIVRVIAVLLTYGLFTITTSIHNEQQRQSVLAMMAGEGAATDAQQSTTDTKDNADDAELFPPFETSHIHHTHQDFFTSKTLTPVTIPHDPASTVLIEYLSKQTMAHSPRRDLEFWLAVTQQ